jgi:hypothetical protein
LLVEMRAGVALAASCNTRGVDAGKVRDAATRLA